MLTVLIFLLSIGILVTFHELGHYIFARIFKVKVLTFSIGFGPKILKFQGKHNEWCISAIPLGGYMRVLDEREGPVPNDQKNFAFNLKAPYKKIIIASAGPIFNIILAFVLCYCLALSGVPSLKPIIASINPEVTVPNNISLSAGAEIKEIGNTSVNSWSEANRVFKQKSLKTDLVQITLEKNNVLSTQVVDLKLAKAHLGNDLSLETIGVYPFLYLPIVAYVEPGSPAFNGGLKVNDRIIMINKIKISNWFNMASLIQGSPGKELLFSVLRENKLHDIDITPELSDSNGQEIGKIGIMPSLDEASLDKNSFLQKYNVISAVNYAFISSVNLISLNTSGIYKLITGNLSLRNLSGPITIAKASSGAWNAGVKKFCYFLALISVSLAVMNILPIPALDGGHILIYLIEWVNGKELAHEFQVLIFKFGFIFVIGLSLIAIYNDILRL